MANTIKKWKIVEDFHKDLGNYIGINWKCSQKQKSSLDVYSSQKIMLVSKNSCSGKKLDKKR